MDLGTDHAEAVKFVNSLPNLYGDVSWIPYEEYKKLGVLPDKVLFGSDIPINVKTGYAFYDSYFKHAEGEELLMYKNAKKVLVFDKRGYVCVNRNFENILKVLRRETPGRPTLFEFYINNKTSERLSGLKSRSDWDCPFHYEMNIRAMQAARV